LEMSPLVRTVWLAGVGGVRRAVTLWMQVSLLQCLYRMDRAPPPGP
jgi:hypothetical protein